MHPAWHIDDIRHLLFHYLGPASLARLAQTCKGLFEPATNELWKTITSVSPFVSCFPRDYRRRPLQTEDLQRLQYYFRKIQKVVLESKDIRVAIRIPKQFKQHNKNAQLAKTSTLKTWDQVWSEVASIRPVSNFWVNLSCIRVSNIAEELLIPLVGIDGSNITQIYIKYILRRGNDKLVREMLDKLQDSSKLEYLFVRDSDRSDVVLKVIKDSPLKHLRLDPRVHGRLYGDYQFKKLPLQVEILEKSTLETLSIGLTREWYTPRLAASRRRYLPALQNLWLDLTTFLPEDCQQGMCINAASLWTCNRGTLNLAQHADRHLDCGRRPPTLFFEKLKNPKLRILNIKFHSSSTGAMLLETVSAAKDNCHLESLTELVLGAREWFITNHEFHEFPIPLIEPRFLREALVLLLPMSQLKVLRISAAPNFLDVLDLELYHTITNGIPSLEKLILGNPSFYGSSPLGIYYYEKIPLQHLATFCSMLPNLKEVEVGVIDGTVIEERPMAELACPNVKYVVFHHLMGVHREVHGHIIKPLKLEVDTYFPNLDYTRRDRPSVCWWLDRNSEN